MKDLYKLAVILKVKGAAKDLKELNKMTNALAAYLGKCITKEEAEEIFEEVYEELFETR
jgi:hypothetical protein